MDFATALIAPIASNSPPRKRGVLFESRNASDTGGNPPLPRGAIHMLRCCSVAIMLACGIANAATITSKPTKPKLPPAPDGVRIVQDVTYLQPDRNEKLDLYLPSTQASKRPAIVFIHGGGWVGGGKAEGRAFNVCTTLAKAGYVAASVNYHLDAKDRWPTNLFDCKNAVRFLRVNADKYNIDADHIGVIGGSAGGHLAMMVAYTSNIAELEPREPYPDVSNKVDAVVNMYGITNQFTRAETDAEGNPTRPREKTELHPRTTRADEKLWNSSSPVFRVTKDSPPTLILHGKIDTTVNREQAIELAEALKKAGIEHELMLLEGVGHTFDLQSWKGKPLPRDLRPVVVDFFDKHLRVKD
jgi:acetyl esterase/lipase